MVAAIAFVAPSAIANQSIPPDRSVAVLRVYGPSGPAPAIREAAKAFEAATGKTVKVIAAPTHRWKDQAMKDADVVFSGSQFMMTDFVRKDLPGLIDLSSIQELYPRPSGILVRPGNPRQIRSIGDLAKPNTRILVVEGSGQTGLWEDVVGRAGNVDLLGKVRNNIQYYAAYSAEAKQKWNSDPSIDAWLTWTIWHKENPGSSELVNTDPESTIYRTGLIALASRSEHQSTGKEFTRFLKSAKGEEIFVKWGWDAA